MLICLQTAPTKSSRSLESTEYCSSDVDAVHVHVFACSFKRARVLVGLSDVPLWIPDHAS